LTEAIFADQFVLILVAVPEICDADFIATGFIHFPPIRGLNVVGSYNDAQFRCLQIDRRLRAETIIIDGYRIEAMQAQKRYCDEAGRH
jgi:hypothetical protein